MKMNFTALAVAIGLLLGCSNSSFMQTSEAQKAAKAAINDGRSWDEDAATYISTPAPNLEPIVELTGPEWFQAKLKEPVRVSEYPFDMAVDAILRGTGVMPHFDYDMDLSLPITLEANSTVGEALNSIAARTNYTFDLRDKSIEWHKFATKMFILPVSGGNYSYMIGKSDQSASGTTGGANGQTIDTSAFDVDQKQYSNTTVENINVVEDALDFAKSIVGDFGTVVLSKSTSSILVKTTPDRMRVVSDYMDQVIDDLSTQVALEIRVVQVETHNTADLDISWNAVKELTDGQLNFIGAENTTSFTDSIPVGFSRTSATTEGTVDLLVNALEKQGTVSFLTNQDMLTASGKVTELEMSDIRGYLAGSKVTQTNEAGTSTELIQAIIQSGFSLYTYAKVFKNRVALVISNRASDLDPFEKVGTEENYIQNPIMHSKRFNVNQIVQDGTTVVALSFSQEKASSESRSPVSAKFLPTYKGAGRHKVNIYVLVTPRIIRSL